MRQIGQTGQIAPREQRSAIRHHGKQPPRARRRQGRRTQEGCGA